MSCNRRVSSAVIALLLGAWFARPVGGAPEVPVRGTIVRCHMASAALDDANRSLRVYLPASYGTAAAQARRYPVVYMLHGWPGGDGNWPGSGRAGDTLDSLIATRRIPDVIAVMPNGNGIGFLGRSLYVNTWDGASRMEDFIARELPAWIDSVFRTRREPAMRAILGLSDGGFGAFNLGFRHTDVFGAAGSHSGDFRVADGPSIRRIIGSGEIARKTLAANSPLDYVAKAGAKLSGMPIYFDCGVDDEDLADNRALHAELDRLRVPHTYREFSGGHGWGYWKDHLHESLVVVTRNMWPAGGP